MGCVVRCRVGRTAVLGDHVCEAFDGALTCEYHSAVFGAGGFGIAIVGGIECAGGEERAHVG